jgi:hypothetical protein
MLAIHGLALLGAERFAEALPFLTHVGSRPLRNSSGHYNTLISCCGHLGLAAEAQEYLAVRKPYRAAAAALGAAREPAAVRASRGFHCRPRQGPACPNRA